MLVNSSQVSYFTLAAYCDLGLVKYVIFVFVLCLYVSIIVSNLLLIVVICMNRSLHEPMYLFLCSLFMNELWGSTGLFPLLLLHILADVHNVSSAFCFLQNFCLYSYGGAEYLILAVMSYDRYLAICRPLQYHTQMTINRIFTLIGVTWFCPLLLCLVMTSLSNSLTLCGNIIKKVYCDNYSIVKLSCEDTTSNNIYGLFVTCCSIFCPLVLIFFSYVKILKICFSGCKQSRQKALNTCSPHLASLINFSCGACFEIMQSRFDMKNLSNMMRIFLSLYWLTCQPLLNPLLYGLNLSKIRNLCKSLVSA
ncbi:olfactory receptor 10C1-like [Cynoglossus semilaevis]|uniref:Olfactory receptor n=1 Tax=Cynoglossus semilaevis TaxID=244447 RepID=A0A3P8V4S5_CYNSE|nr:olfactory receptor 10C1-like [Cynoglossus semilaevis]